MRQAGEEAFEAARHEVKNADERGKKWNAGKRL